MADDLRVRRRRPRAGARARRGRPARRPPHVPPASARQSRSWSPPPGRAAPRSSASSKPPSSERPSRADGVAAAAAHAHRPGDQRRRAAVERPAGVVGQPDAAACRARTRRWPRTPARPRCSPAQRLDPPGAHRDLGIRLEHGGRARAAQPGSATASSSRKATTSAVAVGERAIAGEVEPLDRLAHVAHVRDSARRPGGACASSGGALSTTRISAGAGPLRPSESSARASCGRPIAGADRGASSRTCGVGHSHRGRASAAAGAEAHPADAAGDQARGVGQPGGEHRREHQQRLEHAGPEPAPQRCSRVLRERERQARRHEQRRDSGRPTPCGPRRSAPCSRWRCSPSGSCGGAGCGSPGRL